MNANHGEILGKPLHVLSNKTRTSFLGKLVYIHGWALEVKISDWLGLDWAHVDGRLCIIFISTRAGLKATG